ncbi:MAG: sulfatase-like hydrolase/transferase [Deltaproteobacteria bacterium]|nr:sulfatase-like hydrolase/transferase [Deltaproteobacteria bacterium]
MNSNRLSISLHISWCQLSVFFGFLIHRILLSSHPLFSWALEKNFPLHSTVGLSSDLFFVCLIVAVLEWARLVKGFVPQTLALVASWGATIYLLLFLAGNLRLAQHFGIQTRWEHFQFVGTFADIKGGSVFLLMAKGTWWITLLATALGFATTQFSRRSRYSRFFALGTPWKRFVAWLLLAGLFEVGHVQMRKHFGVYAELENNVFANIYYSFLEDRKTRTYYDEISSGEVTRYRARYAPQRSWDAQTMEAPLAQNAIATGDSEFQTELTAFIREKAKQEGPWNVIIVIQESLRADRLSSFGPVSERFAKLTPHFSETLTESITFQETIATGTTTPEGQSAILCSLYSLPVIQMIDKPQLGNVCLGDYFAKKGYETFFFVGQNGAIHNQRLFHEAHNTKTIVEEKDFDHTIPRGAWGVNDHSLFQKTVETLQGAEQPFFATVLTISYHGPYTLPSDSPFPIDPSLDDEQKVLSYVDAAWGDFFDKIRASFPHTLVVMVSDHGIINEGDLFTSRPFDYENIRQVYRIPFAIFVPELPEHLQGHAMSRLTSNADIPPTLLSLLGDKKVMNNFMGMDAFSRDEWIGIRWLGELYRLYPGQSPRLESLPDAEKQFLVYLIENNLFKRL